MIPCVPNVRFSIAADFASPLMRTTMRGSVMLGIALVVVGAAVYFRGGFTTKREVLKIGDVSVSAEEKSPIAPWAAGFAVVAGIVLVSTGARRKV